jgi:hypothetical protein
MGRGVERQNWSLTTEVTVAKPEELKKGVKVWIKAPKYIYADVIGPRPGDAGLPLNEVTYEIQIEPSVQYLPPDALELCDPPTNPDAPLKSFSREWTQELRHCGELAERALGTPADQELLDKIWESLTKLGFATSR